MTKRKAEYDESNPSKKSKRESKSPENRQRHRSFYEKKIESLEALSLLLSSTQLHVDELIQRLATFKSFLSSIAYSQNEETTPKTSILVKYLHSQISVEDEDRSRSVPDAIKIAHYACQINSENLFSSVTSAITLLLKTISDLHEMRDIGNSLCRLMLDENHVNLIERGMSAAKPKEHLISPCLRLLREIILFDGGRAARAIYRQRHITFQRLEVFLTMRGAAKDDNHKTRKRPSVRNNAISYLLANLRLQSQTAKCYVLGRNKWMRSLLSDIGSDPPGLIHGVLDTLRKDVVEDERLPLTVKGRFFDDWTLNRLATLYSFKNDAPKDGEPGIRDLTHALLQTIFVSNDHSLLISLERQQARETLEQNGSDSEDTTSLQGQAEARKLKRNLVSFLRHLRPHANNLQTDLLLSCFQISPRLLQAYFSDSLAFSFDPKLTATWIGYSQFILGIVQQPLPETLVRGSLDEEGQSMSLLLDHILPPSLTQKVLTRCLNQSSLLVKFFTSRILVAAFEKVIAAQEMLRSYKRAGAGVSKISGVRASCSLLDSFSQRLPRFRDVTSQFIGCPETAIMLRESLLRLLVCYYRETPQLALAENFDISTSFSNSLAAVGAVDLEEKMDGVLLVNLGHLLQIASRSPSVRWWRKSNSTSLSLLTDLLKAHIEESQNSDDVLKLLKSFMEQNYLTWPAAPISGAEIFIYSLQNKATVNDNVLYAFLDNCFLCCAKKPVVYVDLLDDLVDLVEAKGDKIESQHRPDLLMITFMEQLPFLVAQPNEEGFRTVAMFLQYYIDLSLLRGVSRSLLILIRDAMKVCFENDGKSVLLFGKTIQDPPNDDVQEAFNRLHPANTENNRQVAPSIASTAVEAQVELDIPPGPPIEDADHHGLTRWTREDIEDAVADKAFTELILCLCSDFEEIRKQASMGIRKFIQKLEFSGYSEWQQVRLLAGELLETASNLQSDERLPYVAGVFASRMLQILNDPLHFLYKKVNNFLNKGPQWTVEKLPSYWTDKILLRPPTKDDRHYQEIEWLLKVLADALRTPKDMDIYRRCHILEKILTLAASPELPVNCFEQIIDLLFRCTYVEGSTILITRCGLMSWLANNVIKRDVRLRSKLVLLGRHAYEKCDKARVDEWSGESLSVALARLDSLDVP